MIQLANDEIKKVIFVGLNGFDFPETRIRCRNFAESLEEHGWETEVFSFREQFFGDRPEVSMFELPDEKRIELIDQAIDMLEERGPAILYIQKVHYHAAAPYVLGKKHDWPLVLDYDDYDLDRSPLLNDRESCEKYFDGYGAEQVTANLARTARACITASQPLCQLVAHWNPDTYLIETGVKADHFAYAGHKGNSGEKKIIWTGQIWGEPIMRSLDMAFKAARLLHRKGIKFSLELYGRGFEKELSTHLERKFPGVPVNYKGWVDPDEMAQALSTADAGLYPLVFSNIDHEWMRSKSPTKMFEYMAAGIPVAAVDIDETRRVLCNGKAGMLCRNEFEMAEKLEEIFNDPKAAEEAALYARKLIDEKYSLEVLGGRLSDILNTVNK